VEDKEMRQGKGGKEDGGKEDGGKEDGGKEKRKPE
jgi:hypothetical protein